MRSYSLYQTSHASDFYNYPIIMYISCLLVYWYEQASRRIILADTRSTNLHPVGPTVPAGHKKAEEGYIFLTSCHHQTQRMRTLVHLHHYPVLNSWLLTTQPVLTHRDTKHENFEINMRFQQSFHFGQVLFFAYICWGGHNPLSCRSPQHCNHDS
jgi:hypothetical protein